MWVPDPLVSVIIPVHNRKGLIARAITSALAQTHERVEVLVIDDASTDGTHEEVATFTDARVRLLRHERNRGVSAARNTGISKARGTYLAFLDSDDEWHPAKMERQLELFRTSPLRLGLVYCGMRICHHDGTTLDTLPTRITGVIPRRLLVCNHVVGGGSTAVIPREVADVVGYFDEDLKTREDLDMWLRISQKYPIDFVNESLATVHGDAKIRLSSSFDRVRVSEEAFFKKYLELLKRERLIGPHILYHIRWLYRDGQHRELVFYWLRRWRQECPWSLEPYWQSLRYVVKYLTRKSRAPESDAVGAAAGF